MTIKDLLAVIANDVDIEVWTKSGKQFYIWSGTQNLPNDDLLTAKITSLSAETEGLRQYFYIDIDTL